MWFTNITWIEEFIALEPTWILNIIELLKGTEDSEFYIEEFDLNFTEKRTKDETQSSKINKEKIRHFLKSESVLFAVQELYFNLKKKIQIMWQKVISQNKVDVFIYKTKFDKMKIN